MQSFHALIARTLRLGDRAVQECAAGLVEVRRGEGILSFAAPPTRRSGELEDDYLTDVVTAFGINRNQVLSHQWVDNGPGWAVVQLATAWVGGATTTNFRGTALI